MYTNVQRVRQLIGAAVFALLLAGCATQVAKPDKIEGVSSGAVAGTLTINGQASNLRYAYARRHQGSALDAKRLRLPEDKPLVDGVAYVILTNRPVSEEQIAKIVDGSYDGVKNLNGVLLAIDPSDPHHWESQILTDTQMFSIYGFTSTGGPPPKIENGRIVGMLALRNQDAIFERAFLVYFDAPLALSDAAWTSDIGQIGAAPCGSMQGFENFTRTLPGQWAIETWAGEAKSPTGMVATSYTGKLTVDERISKDQFHGSIHFVIGDDKPDVDEQVTLTCSGAKVSVRGAVIPETRWIPDTLELELTNKRLVGNGMDAMGQKQHAVLKKID